MLLSQRPSSTRKVSLASGTTDFLHSIKEAGYPNCAEARQFANQAFILKVCPGGYVWFYWADADHASVEIHAAVPASERGRWLTREIIRDIQSVVRVLGPRRVIANPTTGPAAKALRRLGFTQSPEGHHVFEVYSDDDSVPVGSTDERETAVSA